MTGKIEERIQALEIALNNEAKERDFYLSHSQRTARRTSCRRCFTFTWMNGSERKLPGRGRNRGTRRQYSRYVSPWRSRRYRSSARTAVAV